MEKLITIQSELKVPKGNFNSFGKYKYRSTEDILEAVKPILLKHKCILNLSDEIEVHAGKVFLRAVAKITDGTKVVTSVGYAETSEHKGMSAEQTTGTASSYARKYALGGLFLIDETEADSDSDQIKIAEQEAQKNKVKEAEFLLESATDLASLQSIYLSLSVEMRKITLVKKDELKIKLTPKQ